MQGNRIDVKAAWTQRAVISRDFKRILQRDDTWSIFLAIVTLAAYSYCISGSPSSWDTAELQTVPFILGIPHPTGFPLFVIIGWVFTHAVLIGSVAWRMNFLSATCMTVATIAIFRAARSCGLQVFESLLGAAIFSCGLTVLDKALHTDVHAMSTMLFTLVLLNALNYERFVSVRFLYLAWFFEGLGLATHPTAIWWIPAIAVSMACNRRAFKISTLFYCSVSALLPLLLYLYLPLRSWAVADPNFALGLGSDYAAIWNTNNPGTWPGFLREISGSDFGAFGILRASFDIQRYPEYAAYWVNSAVVDLGVVATWLALTGAVALIRWNLKVSLILATAGFSSVPFAVAYSDIEGEVSRYFLPSFVVCAIAAASATSVVRSIIAEDRRLLRALLNAAQLVAIVALVQSNWQAAANERNDSGGSGAIDAVRTDTPSNAIVVATWIDGTSLAYAKYVEQSMGDRHIVIGWPGALHDSYARLSKIAPVYVFVPEESESNLIDSVPGWWIDRIPSSAPGHVLFRVCKLPSTCVRH